MGMPIIEGSSVERKQSVSDIIESVSLEQTALSHILNAEGKKLQAVIGMENITTEKLLSVNDSVKSMVDSITKLETILQSKLGLFGDTLRPPVLPSFYFIKKDSLTNKYVHGAEFELVSDGTVVATATSTKYGRVVFSNIAIGTYTLRESSPAPGYFPNTESYTVVVISKSATTINGENAAKFVVYNVPYPNINIFKTDDLGVPLQGTIFELKQGAAAIATATSDVNGNAVFKNVPVGTYTFSEIYVTPGHIGDSTIHNVTVLSDGTVQIDGVTTNNITIINQRNLINVAGTKSWNDNNNPNNTRPAELTIYLYQNGVLLKQTVTNASSGWQYTFTNLPETDTDGNNYVYSIDEEEIAGYDKTIDNTNIINNIKNVTVTVLYVYDWDKSEIAPRDYYTVPYGSSLEIEAIFLSQYYVLSPSTYTFDRLIQDQTYTFYYKMYV